MKTKLIIDTSTITSLDKLPSFVDVVPLAVIEKKDKEEEKVYDDIKEISIKKIRDGINSGISYKTSQPNIANIIDTIEKDYEKYDRIIINPISSGISSTYNTILGILPEVDKDKKVLLLDSTVASYMGWVFNQKLFKMIEEDKSNDEIIALIDEYYKNHSLFFFLTNIDYLVKGGRLSNFKGFIAKKINLIIGIFWREGSLKPLAKDRSFEKLFDSSLKLELNFKNKKIEDIDKITYHFNKEEESKIFEKNLIDIREKYKNLKIEYVEYELPGAIFVHTGSGGIYFDIFFK